MFRLPLAGLLAALLAVATARAADMPPLPSDITSQGVLRVGVKCDYPPAGFLDSKGQFSGLEVGMAKQLAQFAFGSPDKAKLECVTAENRIPALLGHKIDIIIATLGVTPERARVIDFSEPYRWGGGDILVPKDSKVQALADLKGHKVVLLKGTTEEMWFTTHMPDVELLKLNTVSDAMQALKQGRADAYAHDDGVLAQLAAKNPELRELHTPYAVADTAVGLRKNEAALKAWVNAGLERMKQGGDYTKLIDQWVEPGLRWLYLDQFQKPKPTGA